ncbi:MAG: hypothetical protein GF398_15895 [Chitinivibrionales bacterium]|nr:hypothetical protein [Chitinivibrionales bacterium]
MKRVFLLGALAALLSCQQRSTERAGKTPSRVREQLEEFSDLNDAVVSQPPRIMSVAAAIDLTFNTAVIPQHQSGKMLDKSPFLFEPSIKGSAQWLSQTLIRLTPSVNLKPGTTYKGTFIGKIAFGEQRNVNDYTFKFKTAEQEVLSFSADFVPHTSGKNMVRLAGSITFAQPVDISRVKKDLTCKRDKKRINIDLAADKADPHTAHISMAPVKRGGTGQLYRFTLPESYMANKKKWQKDVILPAANVFKVLAHMDLGQPQQNKSTYGIRFSDPVKKDMNLSGFITIEPKIDFSLAIERKYLKLIASFVYGRNYTIKIAKGFPSELGTKLADEYEASISFTNLKPEIKWVSSGIYLPSDNQFTVQFQSVNVREVHITVTRIYENNLGFFIQNNVLHDRKPNARRRHYGSSQTYSDLNRVGKRIHNNHLTLTSDKNRWVTTDIDLSSAFANKKNAAFVIQCSFRSHDLCGRCINDRNDFKDGDLYYADEDYYNNPCEDGYYYRHGVVSKLLIASEIGLTLKSAGDGLHVYAVDALQARPVADMPLAKYSYQNQLIERLVTDANGHVKFSNNKGHYVRGEGRASLALIRLNHPAWELSSYDISGVDEGKSGIDAFIYADRGVHRPGDTVFLSAIIRSDRKAPPREQAVRLKVSNPLDQTVFEEQQPCGANGHVSFAVPTDLQAPTGNYRAELKVAGEYRTQMLKIETVKPNRLKVAIDIPDTVISAHGKVSGAIESRRLFGTPAADLRTVVKGSFSARPLSIPVLTDYTFGHPLRSWNRRQKEVLDHPLDEEGKASLVHTIDDVKNIPELLHARYKATVYEKGGGFTAQTKSIIVAPHRSYVGIKNPFRWSSAQTGETYKLPIVLTDINGKLITGRRLKVRWYVSKRSWWYDYGNRAKKDFRTRKYTYKIAEYNLVSDNKPVMQKIEIDDNGQHLIEVIDEQGGHSAGMFFWASSWGQEAPVKNAPRPLLSIASDKNVYYTGDEAVLTCETPKEGVALFTIEQGSRILHQEMRRISQSKTSFSISLSDEYVPNCYATISLVQPANRNDNDLPLRIYGIKPLMVENASTRLNLNLQTPKELEPNEKFDISVTSPGPREATITIAIVDEGLLDLTGFETPDAWNHYFQKRRLAVTTRDNFDEILSRLTPDPDNTFSIGGDFADERERRAGESKVQRFKPVVLFAGPTTIKPGKISHLSFVMPNYVGSVRVMLVGCARHSYISQEKTIPVRQPLMVLPTVPRVARPGDIFDVPVSVFAMTDDVKNATVNCTVSKNLSILGVATARCTFAKPGEQDIAFSVQVGEAIGKSEIIVNASSGQHRASDTISLPLTAPNPYYVKVTDTTVSSQAVLSLTPRPLGIEGTNRTRLAVSRFPDIQLSKRLKDLIGYPYGCIEQTTSSAFPQLYVGKLVDLKSYQNLSVTDNINAAINRLQSFRTGGGFTYWPRSRYYNYEVSDWGSSYAGHFLIEARKAGYHVPEDLFDHWLDYAQRNAKVVNDQNHRYQTYRLFLLSLAGKPHTGAMNLVRENYLNSLDPLSKKLLAGAYYMAGRQDAAAIVDKHVRTEITSYRETGGTWGSALRDRCMIAYIAHLMNDQKTAVRLLRSIARNFRPGGWYSTQETAFALLAICTIYAHADIIAGSRTFTFAVNGKKPQKLTLKGYQITRDITEHFGKEITLSTSKKEPLYVSLFEEGIPLEDVITTEQQGLELTRNFYDEDGNPIALDRIGQGDQFWVRYRVQSATQEQLEELALSSVFPSGWEIINPRMENIEPPQWVKNIDPSRGKYMDIRDDRVNWFFDLDYRGQANFVIQCNASFAGTFRYPPVTVEPMYSPESYARIVSQTVKVK